LTAPVLFISFFLPFIHKVTKKDFKFFLRIIYFLIAIIIDILSSIEKINHICIQAATLCLTLISLCPFPLYKSRKDNIVFKYVLYILPFYILMTRSYEGIFLIIYYDYIQLWVKMKWRNNDKNDKKNRFNLIDIFIFIFISYSSFFSLTDVDSIRNFNYPNGSRFIPIPKNDGKPNIFIPLAIKSLMMIKTLLPGLFADAAFYEICKKYKYSVVDSLIMTIILIEIMNIKLFFGIRDFGSWAEIGMSMGFFIISNIFAYMKIGTLLFTHFIFIIDKKINNQDDDDFEKSYEEKKIISDKTNGDLGNNFKSSEYDIITKNIN